MKYSPNVLKELVTKTRRDTNVTCEEYFLPDKNKQASESLSFFLESWLLYML
jgi:hypothetical protein